MEYRIISKSTGLDLTFEQQQVFNKLLEIRGPKVWSPTIELRWRKGYAAAVKDFEDIYGFEPQMIYKEKKKWKKYENQ